MNSYGASLKTVVVGDYEVCNARFCEGEDRDSFVLSKNQKIILNFISMFSSKEKV